jgi:PAS domain S-box-containing protein
MRGILGERGGDLGLALYDGELADPGALLHASDPAAATGAAAAYRATRHLAVAGRPWTLVAEARPALVERFPTYEPPLVAVVGALASLLVAALVWLLASGSERALRLAVQLDLDRAAAQRARQDTEALLREIVDTTPDLVFVKDAAGRHLLANPAMARVVGRPAEALQGLTDAEMLGPEAAGPLLEHDALVKRTGTAHAFEEVVETPAGPRTYLTTKAPRRDADGAITGVIGIARDITERKRIEEALRRREAASTSVLGAVEHGVVHLLADGTVSAANPAAQRLFGMGEADLVAASAARGTWRVTDEEGRRLDPAALPDVVTRLTGEAQPETVVGLQRRDGRMVWIAASVRPLSAGPVPLPTPVVVTFRDVTEERRRAAEAWERQQRLALMLAQSDAGFWDRDMPTGRVEASDRTYEIMGYRPGELPATAAAWEAHLPAADRPRVLAALEAHLRGETPIYAVEHRLRRRDGSAIWVESVGRVVAWSADGAPRRMVGTMSDISARKAAEEALRASEGRLRESTAQLRALAVRLQAVREEETARISRDLHDELGQLLTGLQLDLAELEAAVDAPHPAEPLLDKVVAASELTGTVLAAVQRIALDLRPAALDRVGLPAGLRQEARRFEQRTGVATRVEAAADFPELSRDAATALYRICQEALTNVARHAAARRVLVTLSAGPDEVVLAVEDDGRGLAPGSEDQPASLGLLGMRERALALGGEVAFEAAPGGGTRVRARLPAAAAAPGAKGATA